MEERVQKLMAQAGLGSRRACETIIEQGRVKVNGQYITLGDKADPDTDTIEVDGNRLKLEKVEMLYIAVNKPVNVLSSNRSFSSDDRPTIREILPFDEQLHMIGRLDAESGGLMVLTNDGDLTNRLTHPRYGHTKTYKVIVHGLPTLEDIKTWERGVYITDEDGNQYKTAPCSVRITKGGQETTLQIVMTEGKKRQIRRVASTLGFPVKRLIRTAIGSLELGSMKPGEYRVLTQEDVKLLKTPSPELKRERRQQHGGKGRRPSSGSSGGRRSGQRDNRPASSRPTDRSTGSSHKRPSGSKKRGRK